MWMDIQLGCVDEQTAGDVRTDIQLGYVDEQTAGVCGWTYRAACKHSLDISGSGAIL